MSNSNKPEQVSKDALFDSIVKEAGGFYNLVLTVASGFLGGTLIFLEKIAPHPVNYSLVVLYFGWLCLIVSIALSVFVRLKNIESGRLALEGEYDQAKELDRTKEVWSNLMAWALVVGVVCITLFGMINLAVSCVE